MVFLIDVTQDRRYASRFFEKRTVSM